MHEISNLFFFFFFSEKNKNQNFAEGGVAPAGPKIKEPQSMWLLNKFISFLYEKQMQIFRLWRKHVQSFKKIGIKLYEEVLMRYPLSIY